MRRSSAARWGSGVAIVVVTIALAACHPQAPVRVGFLGTLSGTLSDLGVGGRNGAQLAIDALNAADGPRYELLVEDDRQQADRARAAIDTFASAGASFAVGPMTSSMAVAVVPEANRRHLVLITPTATTDELSGQADYFFRVAADAPTGARQLAGRLVRRGSRSLAVLLDLSNRAYTESFARAATKQFTALGGRVVAQQGYTSGAGIDFAALARDLARHDPDTVLVIASPGEAAIVAQQLRRIRPGIGIAITPWGANVQFLQFGGRGVDGTLALQAIDVDSPRPAMREFAQRYRARFGEDPTTPAAQSYEAVMLGAQALQRGGRDALRATLAKPASWPGLDGDIPLDAYGDTTRSLHLTQVHDGRFEALE